MLIICKPVTPQTSNALTEIYMKKRSDKNSKTSAMAEFVGAIYDTILSPAGVQLRDDKEHLICS